MGEIDWDSVGKEFRQRKLTTLTASLDDHEVKRDVVDTALRTDNGRSASAEFERAWSTAGRKPGAAPMLAAYLYARCQAEWELTGNYDRIQQTIESARTGWEQCNRPLYGESAAVELLIQHIETLPQCMDAEAAVNCSCPIALEKHAGRVAADSAEILRSIKRLRRPADDSFIRFLTEIVERHYLTYDAIGAVAHGVLDWIETGGSALDEIDACSRRLRKAEGSHAIAEDVYQSELRAHRYALKSLIRHTPGPKVPDLRISDGRIVYCYPFALPRGVTWEHLEQQVWRLWRDCKQPETPRLAGERPQLLEPLHLSDIWDPHEYQGVVLTLRPLNVHTTAGFDLHHTAELRLSKLGNHYVRIEYDAFGPDFGLHEVYQGLRRAAQVMGDEVVTTLGSVDGKQWGHLHEYAKNVLEDLVAHVDGANAGDWTADFGNDFNVVLQIRQATVRGEDGTPAVATARDVTDVAGQLVLNPVVGYATALEEWTRSPLPDKVENLAGDAGFDTDLITRTDNTTLLVLPGSPNWVYLGQEEKVEFVASLKPLLQQWQRELRATKDEVAEPLKSGRLDKLDRQQVENRRLRLASHVAEVRHCLDLLHSNTLCRPAVHRRLVDRLYKAAGLLRHEEELESEIREAEALYERVAAHLGLIEEENTRKYQRNIQVILAALAALSLVGFIDWINKILIEPATGKISTPLASIEIALVVVMAGAMALWFWRMSRPGGRRRESL